MTCCTDTANLRLYAAATGTGSAKYCIRCGATWHATQSEADSLPDMRDAPTRRAAPPTSQSAAKGRKPK